MDIAEQVRSTRHRQWLPATMAAPGELARIAQLVGLPGTGKDTPVKTAGGRTPGKSTTDTCGTGLAACEGKDGESVPWSAAQAIGISMAVSGDAESLPADPARVTRLLPEVSISGSSGELGA